MKAEHTLVLVLFSLLGCFDTSQMPDEQTRKSDTSSKISAVAMSKARELAIKKVEAVTGKDISSFEIQELPSDSAEICMFLFSHQNLQDLPPGADIAISVNISSGEAIVVSD